jgi:phosphoribosyl 1,2-cyclic phosphodiesterase
MAFDFCSFASGSGGNCYLIKSESVAILVDAGISGRRIRKGLERTGTDPGMLRALLLTHEHKDHVGGLASVMKRIEGIRAYANMRTWAAIGKASEEIAAERIELFVTGARFTIGDIEVKSFAVSHDAAEPVGYMLCHEDKRIAIVTDTGCVDDGLFAEISGADLLVLESNHDEDMLKYGKYPWFLKRRILGDKGHLSNAAAGDIIRRLLETGKKKRRVLLAHLSRENNFPEMAMQTIKNILEESRYYVGADVHIDTILRNEIGPPYEI